MVGETHLKSGILDSEIALDGFNLHRVDRKISKDGPKKGGGIMLFSKSKLKVTILESISESKCFEYLAVRVHLGPSSVVVVGVYRMPSATQNSVDLLFDLVSKYAKEELILTGDVNLNWLDDKSKYIKELCTNFEPLALHQLITESTRPNLKESAKSTLLDILLTNHPDKIVASGVFPLGISDHCPIACIRSTHIMAAKPRIIQRRNIKHFVEESFLAEISQSNIAHTLELQNSQAALAFFAESFNSTLDNHASFMTLRVKDRITPWFTKELITLLREKNKAWALARKTDDPLHWSLFRQLRNKCTITTKKAKSNFCVDQITSSFSDPTKFWKVVNSHKNKSSGSFPTHLIVDKSLVSGQNEICSNLNSHFSSAGHLFDREVPGPPVNPLPTHPYEHPANFTFRPFTTGEVLKVIQSLNSKCPTGEDKLDPSFLKLAIKAPIVIESITHIFNLSIATGSLPLAWKTAYVTPLHKGGDRDDPNNYRPISKLCFLAKALETLVNNQIKLFLSQNAILSPHQSGFRPKHSTISAVTLVTNDIISGLDKKKHCAALFVDLSKAFDTVDHPLLLKALAKIGLDKKACAFFEDYLHERLQCVKHGSAQSTFLKITKGVPQGSILGPVLFTIYINEIVSLLTDCFAHLYADDTVIYCIADTIELAIERLQLAFNTLQTFFVQLKLVLNASKTKFMVFTRAQHVDYSNLCIKTLKGSHIDRVSEYKYLGIWLDDKVTFNLHVDTLASKLRQKIGFLYRNKSIFPKICRKRIIEAVFLSALDYGDIIYGNATSTTLGPLNTVYHSAIRFITGDAYRTHHCLLYDKVEWLSLENRRKLHLYMFIFKALIGKLPPYISAMFHLKSHAYSTRSSRWITYETHRMNSDLGRTAFSSLAPSTWNKLQDTFKLDKLPSIGHFKELIRDCCISVCNCPT